MCSLSIAEIKDIVTIITSITATIIAFLGLRTWRKKLLGKNKYELAIDVIKSLRILIEEIENFRSPIFLANEIFSAYYEIEKKDLSLQQDIEEQKKARKYAQNLRWIKVINSFIDYNSKILHLKVILDNYELDKVNNETMVSFINILRKSLYTQETYDLFNPSMMQPEENRKENNKILEENNLIMYKHYADNELSKNMENYFFEIKKRLKKFLR